MKQEKWSDILKTNDDYLKPYENLTFRELAVVAAGVMDLALRELLEALLRDDKSQSKELFDGTDAPLGSLSKRIRMAYMTCLISKATCEYLHALREARNTCAHTVGLDLNSGKLPSAMVKIHAKWFEVLDLHGDPSRAKEYRKAVSEFSNNTEHARLLILWSMSTYHMLLQRRFAVVARLQQSNDIPI